MFIIGVRFRCVQALHRLLKLCAVVRQGGCCPGRSMLLSTGCAVPVKFKFQSSARSKRENESGGLQGERGENPG